MKKAVKVISWLSLVLLMAAPALFYTEQVSLEVNKSLMMAATIVWFASPLLLFLRNE